MIATHVKRELIWIGLIGRMAVETSSWSGSILQDRRFLKVGQIALIEPHLAIHLIPRRNAAIGQSPLVKGVRADIHLKVTVLSPLTAYFNAKREGELTAFVLCNEGMPVVYIKVYGFTGYGKLASL